MPLAMRRGQLGGNVREGGATVRAVSQETCQLKTGARKAPPFLSYTEVVMLASSNAAQGSALSLSVSQRIATAIFAGVFGVGLLYVTAFANADVLHNAAHDTRHAIVAPCH